MELFNIICSSLVSESLIFSDISLLTDQYFIIGLKKFVQTPESLFFLTSKPVLFPAFIILKTQLLYRGGWRETNSRDHGNPQQVNYQGVQEATSSVLIWVLLWAGQPPSKMTDFKFQHIFFLSSFHTCGSPQLEETGHLLSNLLCSTPGCSELLWVVTQISEDPAGKELIWVIWRRKSWWQQ